MITYEKVVNYIPLETLQTYLLKIPLPDWAPPDNQYHYTPGGSSFNKCPDKRSGFSNPFKMVRGTKFHDHYGPKIVEVMGFEGEFELLYRTKEKCEFCKSNYYWFGGSIDAYIPEKNWLIDFKFTERNFTPESIVEEYGAQVSAYKYFAENGQVQLPNKKWEESERKVDTVTILQIHPMTYEIKEHIVEKPLSIERIKQEAYEYHKHKKHNITCLRKGTWCKWCKKNKYCEVFNNA